ncbi:nuclear transport factor 2 family protein [Amycolatopsis circi]|uniref:nuclear transport factor 2 family protein n=1 Tax=Amycolatopsis circi TaxID=871959 RepID=UPI000E220316|nr:nuclear transport factor 2 family protein [Amycolatopsis circi]
MTSLVPELIPVSDDVLLNVQHFYARQMFLLDENRVAEWLDTFADDGVFRSTGLPEPLGGRAAIEKLTRAGVEERRCRGAVHRHLLTGLHADGRPDGSLVARSYVLVVETLPEETSRVWASTVCQDVLFRRGGGWLVRSRQVSLDRKGHAAPVLETS